MSHQDTDLALPATGVVLVTGGNGAGKSSLVEAVAVAFWGRTLRGTSPWRADQDGEVRVEADSAMACRRRKGSRSFLEWASAGVDRFPIYEVPVEYESTSKAQEALEHAVGPFDLWRRTHVFSSADAAHFTLATDGERKRLLESMLGLDRFDEALERCRADLATSSLGLAAAQHEVRMQTSARAAQQRRKDEARAHLDELGSVADPELLQKELARLEGIVRAYDRDLDALRRKLREVDAEAVRADSDADHARHAADCFRGGVCPTCRETLPRLRYKTLQDEAKVADVKAIAARQRSKVARSEVEQDVRSMEEEQAALSRRRTEVAAKLSAAKAVSASRKRLDDQLQSAEKELLHATDKMLLASFEAKEHGAALGELEACERVLGLKGVRAHVLGRALGGLETCANAWLARIAGPNLRLKVRPCVEKKAGGVTDAIGLEVEGAGGGHGYKAASGGERRRVDVALLMALAEVAQAAHGRNPGTLFFDEVFDALDQEGTEAVAAALAEMSRDRAVVVVSHSEGVVRSLSIGAAERLHVADGRVSPVGW